MFKNLRILWAEYKAQRDFVRTPEVRAAYASAKARAAANAATAKARRISYSNAK